MVDACIRGLETDKYILFFMGTGSIISKVSLKH